MTGPVNAGTNRGVLAPLARRRRIQRVLDDLCAVRGGASVDAPLLDGSWELVYSTAEPFRCCSAMLLLICNEVHGRLHSKLCSTLHVCHMQCRRMPCMSHIAVALRNLVTRKAQI